MLRNARLESKPQNRKVWMKDILLGLEHAFMSLQWLSSPSLVAISQDGWDTEMLTEENTHRPKHTVTMQCFGFFSFQFAVDESTVSVVQYSGSRAQEAVRLASSLTEFKQWVHTRVQQESLAFFVLYKCTLRILQCSKKWEKGSIADVYADNTNIVQEQVIDNRYWFFNNRTWTWRVSCIT